MKKLVFFILSVFIGFYAFSQRELQFGYGFSFLGTGDIFAHNFSLGYNHYLNDIWGIRIDFSEVTGASYWEDYYYDVNFENPVLRQRTWGELLDVNFILTPFGTHEAVNLILGLGPAFAYFSDHGYDRIYYSYGQDVSPKDISIYYIADTLTGYKASPYNKSYFAFGGSIFSELKINITSHWNFSVQAKIQPYWGNIASSFSGKIGYGF